MTYNIVEIDNKKYINIDSIDKKISTQQDVLDVVSICFENNINTLLLSSKIFSKDFFNLKTGLAGTVLQKFINYSIKFAIVLDSEEKLNDRFREMMMEANNGREFRMFKNNIDAKEWIQSL